MKNTSVLSGDLKFINLGDLLQLLSTDSRSGELRIINPNFSEPGIIYIADGSPVDAATEAETGRKAIYALFGWVDSTFEFYPCEITHTDCIKQRMMAIVLDALRELDEGLIEIIETVSKIDTDTALPVVKTDSTVIKGPSIEYGTIVDEDEFGKGETIVHQGRHGNWLWVILEGVVDIIKETGQGDYKIISSGAGAFIGGLSTLIQPDNNRSATAVARDGVQLGVIDAQQLVSELASVNPGFKKILLSLDNRLRYISTRVSEIKNGADKYAGLPKDKQLMIRQGDEVQKVFTILQGNAYVARNTDDGNIYLMTLNKGDFIGKVPFFNIDHEPSFANVFASPDLKLGIVDVDSFQKDYDILSVTMKNIIDYTTICISATTSLACV